MATIAEELLNDFGDSGSENGDDALGNAGELYRDFKDSAIDEDAQQADDAAAQGSEMDADEEAAFGDGETIPSHLKMDAPEEPEEAKARVEKMDLNKVSDVRSVAGLMKQLEPILEKIAFYKLPGNAPKNIGNVDDNPEYKLLTQANTLSTQIDSEVILVHKFIRDHYSVRFPELETLVQGPLEYAKTVAIIGNGPMESLRQIVESKDNMLGMTLRQVLDGPSVMVVTVEATTTAGQPLSEKELETVQRACSMMLKLENSKKVLTDYVQSRMSMFAPNLTTLIGSITAAQLLNYTGGISGLAKTPSCNLAALGNKSNRRGLGLATNTSVRSQGVLYQNDVIREVPNEYKAQAMRILSAKIVLAARVDLAHESPRGEIGLDFADQVEKRINKLSEAAPNASTRALPAPDDKPARKRGGRQARRAKAAVAQTDLSKAQNRMVFGKEEREVGFGDSTKGLGMIGMQDDGRVRKAQIDQRTKAKLGKKNPGWGVGGAQSVIPGAVSAMRALGQDVPAATGLRGAGVGSGMRTQIGNSGGTASTIAFTPVQGLELVNPALRQEINRKRKAEEDRWFKDGTFTNVGGSSSSGSALKVDSGGFKVPALPFKKQKQDG
jgi:U4/U6 small nuclear ribonucleoprotein PRP31